MTVFAKLWQRRPSELFIEEKHADLLRLFLKVRLKAKNLNQQICLIVHYLRKSGEKVCELFKLAPYQPIVCSYCKDAVANGYK